jgi:uncharacterized protein YoxC
MDMMSLRFKLLSLIGVCVVAFILFGTVAWNTIDAFKVNGEWYFKIIRDKDLIADVLPPPEYIIESYLLVYEMLDERDGSKLDALVSRSRSLRENYEERHAFWVESLPSGELREEMISASYKPAMDFFRIRDEQVIPALAGNNREEAAEMVRSSLKPLYEKHRRSIDRVVLMAVEDLEKDEATVKEIISNRIVLLMALGITILAAILLCALSMNVICSGLIGRVAHLAEALSIGGEQIATAADQLTGAGRQLAQGVTEQAAAIEQTSASLEEMSSMTRQNAQNARDADRSMTTTSQVVEEAKSSVSELISAMNDISMASEKTHRIIKTIDEIAFKTNLLRPERRGRSCTCRRNGAGFAVVPKRCAVLPCKPRRPQRIRPISSRAR